MRSGCSGPAHSTKNPNYSDVKYIEPLIGLDTVNTAPLETIDAYRDHGNPKLRLEQGVEEANWIMARLPELGISIDKVTQQLEDEGVKKFDVPFDKLMETLTQKASAQLKVESMKVNPYAGKLAEPAMLVNVPRLVTAYYTEMPDPSVQAQRVAFGTSGHRGSAFQKAFNEWHILAISQAICLYRRQQKIDGPLFLGMDTHALSVPALASALEVLAANGVDVMIAEGDEYTPTPAVSPMRFSRTTAAARQDSLTASSSHHHTIRHMMADSNTIRQTAVRRNPSSLTGSKRRQTSFLKEVCKELKGFPSKRRCAPLRRTGTTILMLILADLANVLDMDAIRGAKISLGVDPLGGAGVHYWEPIAERYGLNLTVVNEAVDPTFRFMTVDWDGQIRMDPSSPYAMQRLIGLKDRFDIAFACDTDHDRHGIVTKSAGLAAAQSLPFSRHLLSLSTPAEVAQGSGGRQDGGEQPDDRSRHREAWAEALRGASRLQVVCGWTARRLAWLWRGRECGRVVCPSGWQRLDDR